jgi:hypothetical protein
MNLAVVGQVHLLERRYGVVESPASAKKERAILDQQLTELALLAKKLCPKAKVEWKVVRCR